MTDTPSHHDMTRAKRQAARLKQRYRAERRFRALGVSAVLLATGILVFLMSSIIYTSLPAFTHHNLTLEVVLSAEDIEVMRDARGEISSVDGNWLGLARSALRSQFPEVTGRREKRELYQLLSIGAGDEIQKTVTADPSLIGQTMAFDLPLSDDIDLVLKGLIDRNLPQSDRLVSDLELTWLDALVAQNRVSQMFAFQLFTNGDSREPEMAGLKGAIVGSLLTLMVTLLISFPLGVLAAVYLQEMAPKNRLTAIIEVNINNLAAVPSIVFGLLGLAVFISFFQMPRSAPLVGGMVLALMTLPTIIIATRASLASVPPSIRQAAMGVGASRLQVILHHVLPLAMPGILTGTIIGLAQAAGETAPLLMIGMMAFIVDTPTDITSKATVLPAQVYMWANNPERAFVARTSAAIVVLLSFLMLINGLAIYFRKRFEKRW
ncbi:phosphate ABC transporter permease PstA [Alphaproteobacteria bacterium]|nr:phosphate ABC transporter permease PstA [Alphaproteobacteria bacterium]